MVGFSGFVCFFMFSMFLLFYRVCLTGVGCYRMDAGGRTVW